MKIVIDIPEMLYDLAQKDLIMGGDLPIIAEAIKNGTPLSADGDLISRIEKLHTIESTDGQEYYQAYDVLRTIKEYMETAEPKNAEWISKDISDFVFCSNCNYKEWYYQVNKYCPNCGAKMEVEE